MQYHSLLRKHTPLFILSLMGEMTYLCVKWDVKLTFVCTCSGVAALPPGWRAYLTHCLHFLALHNALGCKKHERLIFFHV